MNDNDNMSPADVSYWLNKRLGLRELVRLWERLAYNVLLEDAPGTPTRLARDFAHEGEMFAAHGRLIAGQLLWLTSDASRIRTEREFYRRLDEVRMSLAAIGIDAVALSLLLDGRPLPARFRTKMNRMTRLRSSTRAAGG